MARRYYACLFLTATLLSGASIAPMAQADTLQEALIGVYNKNPQLLAARARLRETDENYIQARAQGRLSSTASGQYSWSHIQGTASPAALPTPGAPVGKLSTSYTPSAAQVEIIQPLYQGGRIKALKAQAKAGILAQRELLRATENQLFLAASNAYLDVQLAEETARVRRENVRVLSRQSEAAQERFDVGQGTRTDIAQSLARLANAESGLAQAEGQLLSARASYRRLVGRIPSDLQRVPQFVVPATLEDALRKGRENNPEIIASYFNEQAGDAAIDVAKSASKPVISLNGNLAAQRGQVFSLEESESAEIKAQIRIPIFSGGANKSRVRQARHAKTRMRFETRDRELAVDEAITQIWSQRAAAQQSLMASRKQVEAAELAFEGVTLEQEVGSRSQLDVLDAEREALNARLAVINAEKNVHVATFQLLSTIGVFDAQSIGLAVDTLYDVEQNLEDIREDKLNLMAKETRKAVTRLTSQSEAASEVKQSK